VNLNDPMLRMTRSQSRTSADLVRYLRTEYGTDDPTWLLSNLRAPSNGARSFSRPRLPRVSVVRRAARALASMLL
jgi:hypothetical protein